MEENVVEKIDLENHYEWIPVLYELPAEISYDVTCNNIDDEFLPCFSFNKAEWGVTNPAPDALSWYLSPHRCDFTFRTNLFEDFPLEERHCRGFNLDVGRTYHVRCEIHPTRATYFVNNAPYATARFQTRHIPQKGYFGFAVYEGNYKIAIRNILTRKIK